MPSTLRSHRYPRRIVITFLRNKVAAEPRSDAPSRIIKSPGLSETYAAGLVCAGEAVEGMMGDYLFRSRSRFVAAGTFKGIVRGESISPIVAGPAGLASIHISHPEGFALLHRKDLRVTVRAFEACIPMGLTVKDDSA